MGRKLKAAAGVLLAAGAATTAYVWPPYTSCPSQHAPFTERDQSVLRTVSDDKPVPADKNPGIRAWPEFVSQKEAQQLLKELQPLKREFGVSLISPQHGAVYKFQQSYLPRASSPPVNMMRITGRPEGATDKLPKWGYGDEFNEAALPPQIRALVARVRALPGVRLGPLRDVTINYRHSTYFRLDPHLDPQLDGENVFILGLDSDTVLTFCPLRFYHLWKALGSVWSAVTLEDEREGIKRDAEGSWTPLDIDVLARARGLVHFSGDARWTWTHGTRLGTPVLGQPGLHDHWGDPGRIVQRSPERHSIVLAFAAAPESEA